MELLSDEIYKIVIKKKNEADKKYILHSQPENNIIGYIPFFWKKRDILSENKKIYLNPSTFLLEPNNHIYNFNFENKKENETIITYNKRIKKEIIRLFEEKYDCEGLKTKNIVSVLEIKNIKIYVVNINKNKKLHKKFCKNKFKNELVQFLYFKDYTLYDKDVELFEHIMNVQDNDYVLNKKFNLGDVLELKIKTILEKIVKDLS